MTTTTAPLRSLPEQVHQCRRLAQVLQMTRQMLTHAQAGEWQAVTDMERDRREDLVKCFSEPIPLGDSELVAEAIATLLHLNEELMAKLQDARNTVLGDSAELMRNRRAISSYEAVDAAQQSTR